ncbi:DUF5663 domain-containing protein [Thermodesulforhabdus norvegica]|uniref:Uncharacterized protein n=1 Tax=Thermodesulforhabdus norvegica TaxID=39841 RepID=A0A1I4RBC0_9BACT|nr:DUF5663 domain-containing protein [Thermodesulforhabdus norvegica]SFM49572.1 hypothetical protein SAMN05660836_00525 [Thermodesulforhabdus norvegica]
MDGKIPTAKELMEARPLSMKNPYILNFCRALVEKKGEKHSPESLKKLLNDMYKLFENLLGQNMVKALPEDKRREYLAMCEDLRSLTYEKIAEIFDKHVPNYREVMKQTMIQFTELFMRNRKFDPEEIQKRIQSDEDIVLD